MCYRNGTGHRCECCGTEEVELRIVSYDNNELCSEKSIYIGNICKEGGCDSYGCRKDWEPVLMVAVTPGEPMKIITESEAEEYLPAFEHEDDISEVPEVGLVMSYRKEGVFQVGDRCYLDTSFLIYNLDEDGETISLSGKDLYAVQELLKKRTVMVRQDGEEMPVIDLN